MKVGSDSDGRGVAKHGLRNPYRRFSELGLQAFVGRVPPGLAASGVVWHSGFEFRVSFGFRPSVFGIQPGIFRHAPAQIVIAPGRVFAIIPAAGAERSLAW